MNEQFRIAFVGTGGVARCHAFALAALPYYYNQYPTIKRIAVCSIKPETRKAFATRFNFERHLDTDTLWKCEDINTIYLLGPNRTHYTHLIKALKMSNVNRIYVEKPLCASIEEEMELTQVLAELPLNKTVQVGFQFLQMGAIRRALTLSCNGCLGVPIHFRARYLHSGYLDAVYRSKRRARLQPAPAGGATADLGSHLFSLLVAFLGNKLEVINAEQSGCFKDVVPESDLFANVVLFDHTSGATGSIESSRISPGSGDLLEIEIEYTKGGFRFSTEKPEILEVFMHHRDGWTILNCGNDYTPVSTFPSPHVPSGWLRSLIHAHYLFFGGLDPNAFIPDLNHGLKVQRLIRQTAEKLDCARRRLN